MFEFYCQENIYNELTSTIVSLIITLVATFFGFLGAFYLSTRSERIQKKNEIKKQRDIYVKRLTYLTILITSSLDSIEKQLVKFELKSKEIKKQPSEVHILKIIASEDLYRLQKMNSEGIFLVYNEIISGSEEKLKDYKNIYSTIDFIYLKIKQTIDSNEKQVNFCYRDQMYIKEKVDGLSYELIKMIKTIESDGGDFKNNIDYKFATFWHRKYCNLVKKQSNFGIIEKELIIPFSKKLEEKHDKKTYLSILYDFTSKSLVRYNHLKTNSNRFADEMENIRNEMSEHINYLKEINDKIKCAITTYGNLY